MLKAGSSDMIQFISANFGVDTNDGLSPGSAKLTPQAARLALPSCTIYSNTYAHCGTIFGLGGTFPPITSTWTITDPVAFVGIGEDATFIQCNVNGPCINATMSPFAAAHGPRFENLHFVNLNTGSSAIWMQAGGMIEPTFRNLWVHGWNNSGQVSWLWNNPSGTFSERVLIDHVHLDNASGSGTALKFTDTNSAVDFLYWRVYDLEINFGNGGVGIDAENDCQLSGWFMTATINTGVTSGGGTVFLFNGTSQFGGPTVSGGAMNQNQLFVVVDNSLQTSPVTLWSVASGAQTNIYGQVIGTNGTTFSNSISGTFASYIANTFPGSSTAGATDLSILAHGSSGNPGNVITLRYLNPSASRTYQVYDLAPNYWYTLFPTAEVTATYASVNFGTALGSQSLVTATASNSWPLHVIAQAVQSLLGVGCSTASNTVIPSISFTAPGGTAETVTFPTLTISGNGTLDSGSTTSSANGFTIVAKGLTSLSYSTTSTLASTGCTTPPQYTLYVSVME
jgi:hypothetical protein